MPKTIEQYISLQEFLNKQELGKGYEGFVTGVGYAYTDTVAIRPPNMNGYQHLPHIPPRKNVYQLQRLQRIDRNKAMVELSYPKEKPSDIANIVKQPNAELLPKVVKEPTPVIQPLAKKNTSGYQQAQESLYKMPKPKMPNPTKTIIGSALAAGQEMYYSEKYGIWMGKNYKLYKLSFHGNLYTGGQKKLGKRRSQIFKGLGLIFLGYNFYDNFRDWQKGEITGGEMLKKDIYEGATAAAGIHGAAWELGTYLGEVVVNTDTYQEWKYNSKYTHYEAKFGKPNEENENLWMFYFYNQFQ